MKAFNVEFCLDDKAYMTALRLAVGAVCSLADLDVDGVEDMKVCVTESCLILKGCGYERVRVELCPDGGFCAVVEGVGGVPVAYEDGSFSIALISALVSSCDIERRGDAIGKISFKL